MLELRGQTLAFLEANFGKSGTYYYWISRGIDERPVRANRIRKSVGAENTFFCDLTKFDAMIAELQPLVDKVWRHCETSGNRGRTVTLKTTPKLNDPLATQHVIDCQTPLVSLPRRVPRSHRFRSPIYPNLESEV
jgi:nucleotidyltransferase/DNA polymerase involved in DNA repair